MCRAFKSTNHSTVQGASRLLLVVVYSTFLSADKLNSQESEFILPSCGVKASCSLSYASSFQELDKLAEH